MLGYSNEDKSYEEHEYENGICKHCGLYQPAPHNDNDNCFEIYNAGNLYWFAQYVNQGGDNLKADAILVNNIVVKNTNETFREWTPIGNYNNRFQGTFDGNGKTISGLYFDNSNQNYVGLFGSNEGTIKNVGVVDSYFKGKDKVGGVCGYNFRTIENCYNTGEVSGEWYIGGVCGYNEKGTITNCYNTGEVSGTKNIGGVCGYNNIGTITNCYNTGVVSGSEYIGGVCGNNYNGDITNCYNTGVVSGSEFIGGVCGYNVGTITNCYNTVEVRGGEESEYIGGVCGYNVVTITNCYYLSNSDNKNDAKTQEQFINGCVAYLLSQGNNGGVWGQDLSKDNLPMLNGSKVYKNICEDVLLGYSNEDKCYEKHEYENGICKHCGSYQLAPHNDNDNCFEIYNAGNLYWFAEYVNQGGNNLNANAKLMNNIVVNKEVLVDGELKPNETFREWTPIGNNVNPYKGTFDGNGKTISGLYFNNSDQDYVGLFGYNEGTIKNVGVVESYFKGNSFVGGVCGYNVGPITNCYNTGEVSGSKYIGGVCGYNYSYSSTIENCYNTGVVSGGEESKYIGGVSGYNYGTITNCYNTGEVSGGEKSEYIGGVCGKNNSGTITNCYNNSYFCDKDEKNGVTNKTTFDFCNGNLFDGFSKEIWSAGSAKVEIGKVIFTLPYFIDGYKPIIKGEFVVKVNSEKKYYFDTEFAKEDITEISIKVGNNTYEDKSNLELIDTDLKDGLISGTFYGVEFSASVNLTDYTYKTQIFTWNTETVPPTAKVSAECNENYKHNIDNADCEITKVEGSEIAATCVKAGTADYKATYKTLSDTKTVDLPALGHKYGEPTFSWTDYTKAVATFACVNGDTTITVEGKITSEKTVEPTATQKGKMVYTATFEFNGNKFTDKKEQDLEPTPTHEISQNSQYKVWGYNGVVYIETENTDSQVQIFDINGRLIKSESLTNSHSEIIINKKGVFVVVINNISYKVTL